MIETDKINKSIPDLDPEYKTLAIIINEQSKIRKNVLDLRMQVPQIDNSLRNTGSIKKR